MARPIAHRSRSYRLRQALVAAAFRSLTHLSIEGTEHYPPIGPYLVVTNHLHWLDVPLAFVALRHEAVGLAATDWAHHPIVGLLGRGFGRAIPVQNESDHRAMAEALRCLRGGGVLALAPEGGRSRTGGLRPGRPGAAYLASRTGVPIVPLAAWGHERTFTELRRLRRTRARVCVGQPFRLEGTPNRAKGETLDVYTDHIMRALAALLPPAYRGVYG